MPPGVVSRLPIFGADAHLNKLLIRYAEKTLAHRAPQAGHLRLSVERVIAPLLPHGKAAAPEIARQLGLSPRTLARLFSAEGLILSGILDQYRANLAKACLKHGDLTISQIAWLLGYRKRVHSPTRTSVGPACLRGKCVSAELLLGGRQYCADYSVMNIEIEYSEASAAVHFRTEERYHSESEYQFSGDRCWLIASFGSAAELGRYTIHSGRNLPCSRIGFDRLRPRAMSVWQAATKRVNRQP